MHKKKKMQLQIVDLRYMQEYTVPNNKLIQRL